MIITDKSLLSPVQLPDSQERYQSETTVKTYDRLPINLNSFVQSILDKYKDQEFQGGRALPVLANQLMNRYLKK